MKRNSIALTLLLGLGLGLTTLTAIVGRPYTAAANSYAPPQATPALSINDVSLAEGNAGTSNMVFTVTLTASGARPTISVSYDTADGVPPTGAFAPSDYTSVSNPLIFPSGTGTTTMTISVPINGDWICNPVCPCETSLQGVPSSAATLNSARDLRDKVFANTPSGRRFTDLYYKFSSEAVQIMMLNPMLILRSREMLERYQPLLESMIKGEQVILTRGDIDELDGFLNSFAKKVSAELRKTLRSLCEDLHDPQLHAEFNITVTDGPMREMPAQGTFQRFKQSGMVLAPFGLFVFFLYAVRSRRRNAKAALKRLLSMQAEP